MYTMHTVLLLICRLNETKGWNTQHPSLYNDSDADELRCGPCRRGTPISVFWPSTRGPAIPASITYWRGGNDRRYLRKHTLAYWSDRVAIYKSDARVASYSAVTHAGWRAYAHTHGYTRAYSKACWMMESRQWLLRVCSWLLATVLALARRRQGGSIRWSMAAWPSYRTLCSMRSCRWRAGRELVPTPGKQFGKGVVTGTTPTGHIVASLHLFLMPYILPYNILFGGC